MIHRIFKLDDLEARDVMTPRNKIAAVSAEQKIKDTAEVFHSKGHARLPVYQGSLDVIKGFVHVIDAYDALIDKGIKLV